MSVSQPSTVRAVRSADLHITRNWMFGHTPDSAGASESCQEADKWPKQSAPYRTGGLLRRFAARNDYPRPCKDELVYLDLASNQVPTPEALHATHNRFPPRYVCHLRQNEPNMWSSQSMRLHRSHTPP